MSPTLLWDVKSHFPGTLSVGPRFSQAPSLFRNKLGREPDYTVVGFNLRRGRILPSISREAVRVSSSEEKVTFSALASLRVEIVLETEAGGEQSVLQSCTKAGCGVSAYRADFHISWMWQSQHVEIM